MALAIFDTLLNKTVLGKALFVGFIFAFVFTTLFISPTYPLIHLHPGFNRMGQFDWPIFIETVQQFLNNGVLYSPDLSLYGPNEAVYKFPPLFAAMLTLLLKLGVSANTLKILLGSVQLICYFAVVISLIDPMVRKDRAVYYYGSVFLLVASFEPFIENFIGLQLEIFILTLLTFCLHACNKQRYLTAGLMIGLATALKLYPIFFVLLALPWLLKNQWSHAQKFLTGIGLGFLLANIFSLWMIGLDQHLFYYLHIAPLLFSEELFHAGLNVSINNVFAYHDLLTNRPALAGQIILLASLTAMALTIKKHPLNNTALFANSFFAVLVSLFVLCTKNSWGSYQLLLILPIMVLLNNGFRVRPTFIVILYLACLLIVFAKPHRIHYFNHLLFGVESFHLPTVVAHMRASASLIILVLSLFLFRKNMTKLTA